MRTIPPRNFRETKIALTIYETRQILDGNHPCE